MVYGDQDSINLISVSCVEHQRRAAIAAAIVEIRDSSACIGNDVRTVIKTGRVRSGVSDAVSRPLIRGPVLR